MAMNSNRVDLSDWALHFVHDYNSDAEPDYSMIDFDFYDSFPYHHDKNINDRFDGWRISDGYYPIDPDPDALQVLLKIITDGHIRASWAFRNGRPTIYGPRAAVCFTEMPLYALVEYAKQRGKAAVGTYAVGVLKRELFAAGGRPAIYGLSGRHAEKRPGVAHQGSWRGWPRYLAESAGLSEAEQYRYVSMSTDPQRRIDWSHEREWRWADHEDRCSCPGLPIWLSDEPVAFSRVFVIVPNEEEIERVVDRLQELHDAGANDTDIPFRRSTLRATSVIALDQLRHLDERRVRLDDIPARYIKTFARPRVTREYIESVRNVLDKAIEAANQAAWESLQTALLINDEFVADVAGWAHLIIYDSQSPLVAALLELGEATAIPGTGYYIHGIGGLGWRHEQALSLAEAGVQAAKEVFQEHFPDVYFGMRTKWD